jgi:two-component system, chemotaxis family, protein-glutamate methylesterase/glutaminase
MAVPTGEKRDTIVLGASAGGIEALLRLLPIVSKSPEASVFVVQHMPADGRSVLDQVLSRGVHYSVAFARDGESILPRRVYIAPPDQHLVVDRDTVRLVRSARENRARPAIDPLFRSAAVSRRGRVMGAVLSGLLDDGAGGLLSVKRCGGLAFVQSLDDAVEPEMPERAATALGEALDGALRAEELGQRMASLIGSPAPSAQVPDDLQLEMRMLLGEVSGLTELSKVAPPAALSCPECGGPLWALMDGRLTRYRCHTGHVYSQESFLSAQSRQIERALWAAIKGLDQRSQMLEDLGRDERHRRYLPGSKSRFQSEAVQLREHAQVLRDVVAASFPIAWQGDSPPE